MMTETLGDNINFDGQQAFDVADLVKQYFRELPEALLTNKLSETFIAIFQREYRARMFLVSLLRVILAMYRSTIYHNEWIITG